jgi:DNA-binding NarL/FixJ family response regulator
MVPGQRGSPESESGVAAERRVLRVTAIETIPRVLLVDDHVMVTRALRRALEQGGNLRVVGEAADGLTACRLARDLHPDVVVMDVVLPELSGIEATREILAASPATRVIALSAHFQSPMVHGMLQAGACGYVTKLTPVETLVDAIRAALRGQMYFTPEVTRVLTEDVRSGAGASGCRGLAALSPRERVVVQLLAEGHSTKQIAARLALSPKTVEAHRHHIIEKLDIHTVAGLVKFAVCEGLTPVDRWR